MKTLAPHDKVWKCTVLVLVFALCTACADEKLAVAKSEVVAPKSVFVDDARSGLDPFYPNSILRQEIPVQPTTTTNVAPATLLANLLALKGISGTKGQRLALINSSTVAVGERAEIKCGARSLIVLLREIRDRSVLIEIDGLGEIRELKLREGT